jgi:hypothetical protein
VDDDIPCRKCSYNLRTLPTNGNCPECGTPVGVSIYGNLLRFSDPAWVGKLADGARYILVGIFMIVVAVIVGMIMGAVLGATGVARIGTIQILVQLISLCGGIFSLVGSWFITEPDPSGIGEDEYGTARKVIRVTLLIQLASFPLNFASQRTVLPPAQRQLIVAISGLMSIAGVVGLIAQLQYFGKLAGRIPDQGLASRANFLKVALSTCYGFLILIGIVAGLMVFARGVAAPNSGIMIGFGCGAGIFGLASLVFGIMYLFMIERFRGRFREQAVLAQQSWAAHPHGGASG